MSITVNSSGVVPSDSSRCSTKETSPLRSRYHSLLARIKEKLSLILNRPGVYSAIYMFAAGFKYTGDGDTARCNDCELEVSNWTLDMDPLTIHLKQKPECSCIRFMTTSSFSNILSSSSSSTTTVPNTSTSNKQENLSEHQTNESTDSKAVSNTFIELSDLQQVRRRTFSHWPHRNTPSSAQMIEAGFFNCNVSDRVICLYCNLICHRWTPHKDDPFEVHRTLSPHCPYVRAKLIRYAASSITIVNESSTTGSSSNHSPTLNNFDSLRSNGIVPVAARHPAYAAVPKRHASFATWLHEKLPIVDALVRAGFFYTGKQTIVTCFYCNGSLHNWGPNNNPMIQHARWFPACGYAQQLCGNKKYDKIQEASRVQRERARADEAKEKERAGVISDTNVITNGEELLVPDESTLSRLVEARLDLPISQYLLDQGFKLSIIKKCWEDQLRLKQDDFASQCDLYVACMIHQKQILHIDAKKKNIIVPSKKMEQIRKENARMSEQTLNTTRLTSSSTDVETTSLTHESTLPQTSIQLTTNDDRSGEKSIKRSTSTPLVQDQSADSASADPCVLCLTEGKDLACIPCGHLATCVPCGHSLRSCPICRRKIEAFIRIYVKK